MTIYGIRLIEKIHYYLCYQKTIHLDTYDVIMFRKQSNILYTTSRICRTLCRNITSCTIEQKNRVYFISYVLTVKWLTDCYLYKIPLLATLFHIVLHRSISMYEMDCLQFLDYSFLFLLITPESWSIY
jgi:hypothetical protein